MQSARTRPPGAGQTRARQETVTRDKATAGTQEEVAHPGVGPVPSSCEQSAARPAARTPVPALSNEEPHHSRGDELTRRVRPTRPAPSLTPPASPHPPHAAHNYVTSDSTAVVKSRLCDVLYNAGNGTSWRTGLALSPVHLFHGLGHGRAQVIGGPIPAHILDELRGSGPLRRNRLRPSVDHHFGLAVDHQAP